MVAWLGVLRSAADCSSCVAMNCSAALALARFTAAGAAGYSCFAGLLK